MSHRIENGVCTVCGADERKVYAGFPCKRIEAEEVALSANDATQITNQDEELVRRAREQLLQHLKFSERTYETGVPPEVLREPLKELLGPSGFVPFQHLGRIEFWQLSDPEAGEFATVCAAFIEKTATSKLKLSFGRFSFIQQVRSAATGLNILAGGLILPALGAGVGLLTVAIEATFWRRVEALIQELSPQFPLNSDMPVPSRPGAVLEQLDQLVRLKDAGAISADEFNDLKRQILSQTRVQDSQAPDYGFSESNPASDLTNGRAPVSSSNSVEAKLRARTEHPKITPVTQIPVPTSSRAEEAATTGHWSLGCWGVLSLLLAGAGIFLVLDAALSTSDSTAERVETLIAAACVFSVGMVIKWILGRIHTTQVRTAKNRPKGVRN